jgi:hypothetical protein
MWQVSHFVVLSYWLLPNTTCNALTLALHSVNQTKEEGKLLTTNVLSVQQTQTVLFLYCLLLPLSFSIFCTFVVKPEFITMLRTAGLLNSIHPLVILVQCILSCLCCLYIFALYLSVLGVKRPGMGLITSRRGAGVKERVVVPLPPPDLYVLL